jgi:hypothetical protein
MRKISQFLTVGLIGVVEDLWVLGDEVEQSVPVDLEFALWHETASIDHHENHTEGYHGYTDGSRRISEHLDGHFMHIMIRANR